MAGVFAKVYVSFWRSGLGAKLGTDGISLLLVLASYMNEEGVCWPTKKQLAEQLGVSEPTISAYLRKLREFRWNGKPILSVEKRQNGAYGNNVYRIADWCQVSIFGAEPKAIEPDTTPVVRNVDPNNIEKARAARKKREGANPPT